MLGTSVLLLGVNLSVDGAYLRWQGAPEVGLGTLGAYAPYADDNFLFRLGLVQPLYTGGGHSPVRGERSASEFVQYREDLSHIWCACHNGHYDLQGRNIAGPPPRHPCRSTT